MQGTKKNYVDSNYEAEGQRKEYTLWWNDVWLTHME